MTTEHPQAPEDVDPEEVLLPTPEVPSSAAAASMPRLQPGAALPRPELLGRSRRGRRGRRGRRQIAVLAATAALAVAALTGGGIALANQSGQASQATIASGSTSGAPTDLTRGRYGHAPGTAADGTTGGTDPYGFGGGASGIPGSAGDPDLQNGTSGTSGTSGTADAATTVATAAQEIGLVAITSQLTAGEAAGTGMILSSTGEVVTNHHVVEGATSIEVTVVSTGATYTARFVGANATTDVAVLQLVDASGLTPVQLDTAGAAVGDSVTAVGDAGGDGGSLTAAPGTVTALKQAITVQGDDGTARRLTGLVELASDIVPGDSGGAVRNSAGTVVGMNVAASTGTSDVTGYAIPITTVLSVVHAVDAGQASTALTLGYDGYLGIGLASSASASVYGVVQDGPAAAVGIVGGDTITAIGGTSVTTADDVHAAIAAHDPGARVTVTWTTQAGVKQSATVTLGEAPIA